MVPALLPESGVDHRYRGAMMALVPALLAVQTAAADTVVTMMARDTLQTAADISLVVLGVFLLVLLVVLIALLVLLRRLIATVRTLGDQALTRADPIVERARGVADNVEFISAAVRTDVERLNRTVKSLTDRLQQASDHMEERIEEFNALMEVVQEEAEDIFVGTASTARGVREGVRTLGSADAPGARGARERGPRTDLPHEEDEVFLTGDGAAHPPGEERG